MFKWLGKHILSLDKRFKVIKSQTTDSVYYCIGKYKIRISNHFGKCWDGENENNVDFVYCLNKKLFTVIFNNGRGTLILDLKESKALVTSLYYQYILTTFNDDKSLETKERTRECFLNRENSWETFSNFLNKEYSYYSNFSKAQRKYLKKIYQAHGIKGHDFIKCFEAIGEKETKNIKNETIKEAFNIS